MRQKFFSIPFATGGDLTTVADPVDVTGKVTFSQGWGPYYQQDPAVNPTTALDIDRASTNYILNVITGALAALQAVGTPEWITTSDNDGAAYLYMIGAKVRYSATPSTGPWAYYVSTVDNNTSVPGADANWQISLMFESSAAQALAGTDGTTTMTPRRVAAAVAQAVTPFGNTIGSVVFFAATTVQTGFLPADGSIVSRTTFAALFAYMGTTFGAGNGTTTFQLPDLRGKFVRAFDNGAGIDPGRVFGSYIADMIKAHNHTVSDPGHNHTLINPAHNHTLSDPTHAHSIYDPGHEHAVNNTDGSGNSGGGDTLNTHVPKSNPTTVSATGIGIYAAATGISAVPATTAVSATATTTGITTQNFGGTETAPKNVALLACIKY